MEALVQQAQAHSPEMSVGGLSQLLYVLGALRYAPSQHVMEDLVAGGCAFVPADCWARCAMHPHGMPWRTWEQVCVR